MPVIYFSNWPYGWQFTTDFMKELSEYDPNLSQITYDQIVQSYGNISSRQVYEAIIDLAGSDGSYID